jgi:uncharacterized NAD-dependent epimerase/dehydratase family protein
MSIVSFDELAKAENIIHVSFKPEVATLPVEPISKSNETDTATAIVYCEGNFGLIDGKTANGLVRHSQKYTILGVIDSTQAGRDAGEVLDGVPNGIPIFGKLGDASPNALCAPDYFIYGMAPATGMLSPSERTVVFDALALGMNVVNGLHEFLNDDPDFASAAAAHNVEIIDIRKPRPKNDLRLFSGKIHNVTCPRIAVLGTDCAIGKRTTASVLTAALVERGIKAVLVTTGQTGMMQGSRHGVALDAVPSQFCCGELEATIVEAFEEDEPDIVIVEGQGALSHPAFSTSSFILRGSVPDGVILQHAPKREHRCDFEQMKMPTVESEIRLIEAFSDTKVIGLTINHENMSDIEIETSMLQYGEQLGLPVTDALARPLELLVDMVLLAFPDLERKLTVSVE